MTGQQPAAPPQITVNDLLAKLESRVDNFTKAANGVPPEPGALKGLVANHVPYIIRDLIVLVVAAIDGVQDAGRLAGAAMQTAEQTVFAEALKDIADAHAAIADLLDAQQVPEDAPIRTLVAAIGDALERTPLRFMSMEQDEDVLAELPSAQVAPTAQPVSESPASPSPPAVPQESAPPASPQQ